MLRKIHKTPLFDHKRNHGKLLQSDDLTQSVGAVRGAM